MELDHSRHDQFLHPHHIHTNFALLAAYPHYIFNWEESWRYQLAQEYYPADFVTLTNYIAQGRWRLAGAAVVAGDVNSPSPEALMRHALQAESYYSQTFGKTTEDIFLPRLLWLRLRAAVGRGPLRPEGLFIAKIVLGLLDQYSLRQHWQMGGAGWVVRHAILQPGAYNSSVSDNLANDTSELSRISNNFAQTGLYLDYRYYGTGDQGGGPSPSSVDWVEQSVTTTNGLLNVLSAGSDQMYRDLTAAQGSTLPVYQGELIMQTHGTGTYTAHAEMKKYNRQNEQRADAARTGGGAGRLAARRRDLSAGETEQGLDQLPLVPVSRPHDRHGHSRRVSFCVER